jgi:peptide/nickel transport system permease protein
MLQATPKPPARSLTARIGRGAQRLGPGGMAGVAVLAGFVAVAIAGPWFVGDPAAINPLNRLKTASAEHWFGTDYLGRDVFAQAIHGAGRSVIVGFAVALIAAVFGLTIGILTGYFRSVDRIVVPMLDGMMAIPGILLAVALVSILGPNLVTIVIAIAVPEVPRMARVVRGVVLSVREQQFVTAAVSIGTPVPLILLRHILPNTIGPVSVQATYACASAVITEAVLSFLGVGGTTTPSWGGMIADFRQYVQIAPWLLAYPGILLSALVLVVNILGDQLRELLDPRLARRLS